MIQDNIMDKEIRIVLTKQLETTNQVSITPMRRPRQQNKEDEDDHPFMDDDCNEYKDWLQNMPAARRHGITSIFLCFYWYCL